MDSKMAGLVIAGLGALLLVYELFASYCSKNIADLCYFPFSPSEPGTGLPWYSIALLVFGIIVYLGAEPENEEPDFAG